jgi:hypothetical protein
VADFWIENDHGERSFHVDALVLAITVCIDHLVD